MSIHKNQNEFDNTIIQKIYQFYVKFYLLTKTFPKSDRFTIAQKCDTLILEILEISFIVNSQSDNFKTPHLQKIDLKLKILKTLIRLIFDTKIINQKKYINLQTDLVEIGKMLGGWMRSLNKYK